MNKVTNTPKLSIHYTQTTDKVRLAIGRYENPGGMPIILAHGLAQNYQAWDFPVKGYSLAQYLAAKGYDVWLPCFRSHGADSIQSEYGDWDWNIDDLAIYDVAAIVEKVTTVAGKSPFWIGHSMGGIVAYMYLQGVSYEENVVGKGSVKIHRHCFSHDVYGQCARGNSHLSNKRNQELRGLITVGSPINMAWANDPSLKALFSKAFWQYNFIFPLLSQSKITRSCTSKLKYIPLSQNFSSFWDKLPALMRWSFSKIASSHIFSMFWYPPNVNRYLIENLIKNTLNDISTRVLEQFADWTLHKTFRASLQGKEQPYNYSDNFSKIELPLLTITGKYDKIANANIAYEQGYSQMGSEDKSFICFDGFGHNDLCMGIKAPNVIFPYIEEWLNKRISSSLIAQAV